MSESALTRCIFPVGSTHHRILGRSYARWRILAMVSGRCLRPYIGLNSPCRVPVIVSEILRLCSSFSPPAWGCLSPSFACRMRSRPSGVCHAVLSRHLSTIGRLRLLYVMAYSRTASTVDCLIIISRGLGTSWREFSSTIQNSSLHWNRKNQLNWSKGIKLNLNNQV